MINYTVWPKYDGTSTERNFYELVRIFHLRCHYILVGLYMHMICSISHMHESHMSHKSMFFIIEPWLITHYHMGFLKFFKVGMCLLLTRTMECNKYRIIRFCIHKIEMAFETLFAPWALHFYFGPSGVKLIFWISPFWRSAFWFQVRHFLEDQFEGLWTSPWFLVSTSGHGPRYLMCM